MTELLDLLEYNFTEFEKRLQSLFLSNPIHSVTKSIEGKRYKIQFLVNGVNSGEVNKLINAGADDVVIRPFDQKMFIVTFYIGRQP